VLPTGSKKIISTGNGFADVEDLVTDAKEKATKIGGDFMTRENSGVEVNGVYVMRKPWIVFSVWVYAPVQTGLRLGENNSILGFHLNSDAPQAGIRMGDILIGIDGIDMKDEKVINHLMQAHAGDKLKISVLRDSRRIDCEITALSN
jgi:S1-C subfamily serine protease